MLIRKGVKLLEEQEGHGDIVQRQREYILSIRVTLNQGEILTFPLLPFTADSRNIRHNDGFLELPARINRNSLIPGLFYAVQGMKIGGYRKVVISPHLAYGDKGLQDMIPPNATLIAEIKVVADAARKRKRQEPEATEAEMLTQDQLCQRYQITQPTLWRWRKAGRMPAPIVTGGMVRWKLSVIEQWETDGRPHVSPCLDEVNEQRAQAFGHVTLLLLRRPMDAADRPPDALAPAKQGEIARVTDEIDSYGDQMLDLMLELALLIDEAGQWHGPPLERLLNDDAAATRQWRNLLNIIEKTLSA